MMNGYTSGSVIRRTAVVKHIVAVDTAVAGCTIVAECTVVVACQTPGSGSDVVMSQHGFGLPVTSLFQFHGPFTSSTLGVGLRSFCEAPFYAYGYQNKACFGTRGLKTFDYRRQEYLFSLCSLVPHLGCGIGPHMGALRLVPQ